MRRIEFPTYATEPAGLVGPIIADHLKEVWSVRRRTEFGGVGLAPNLDALVFQCVMSVNKYELAPEICESLRRGPVVLDRYWPSAVAFGGADGLNKQWLIDIHKALPQPDYAFLLDVDYATSLARRPDRRDRYERRGEDYYNAVRQNYVGLWNVMGERGGPTKWITLDGRKPMDEVTSDIMRELNL